MATKSAPFSMRLSKRMEALVDREAQRTGRSRGAIVEALAEEALRMRLFPGIAFRGVDWERRAWVIGTALDVWQIVDAHRDIGSLEQMAAGGSANERQIRLALDYYGLFARGDRRRDRPRTGGPLSNSKKSIPFIAVSRIEA